MSVSPVSFAYAKLVVDDLEVMAAFYEEAFALTPQARVQAEIAGSPVAEIILGTDTGVRLVILKWLERPSVPGGDAILVVNTPDIEALFERAVAAGARVRQAPGPPTITFSSAPLPAAGSVVLGFLEDPEGRLMQVVEQSQ